MPRKRRASCLEEPVPVPLRRSARIKRRQDEQLEREEHLEQEQKRQAEEKERPQRQHNAKAARYKPPPSQAGRKRQKRAPAAPKKPARRVKQKDITPIPVPTRMSAPAVPSKPAAEARPMALQRPDTPGEPSTRAGNLRASPAAAPPMAAPELTDSFVKSLLPGAVSGLADEIFRRGFWSTDYENNLRHQHFPHSRQFKQFCTAQQQLFSRPEDENAAVELRLWDVLQHRFRSGLDDLFRYGLRPSLGEKDGCEPGGTFAQYCTKLAAILVHPLWGPTHLAHVRWILQRVVQERVPGHIKPLVPPYSYQRPPFADTARHWAYETSMRISLAEPDDGSEGLSAPISSAELAQASRDAARAALRAEAELAQFFFDAGAPRDFYWLDRQLEPLPELGSEDEDEQQEHSSNGNGEHSPNPHGLEVDKRFLRGGFDLSDWNAYPEVTEREDQRRDLARYANWKRDWERHEKMAAKGKGRAHDDGLCEEQVFFDLRAEDLDYLLDLMSQPCFLALDDYVEPHCYLTGYGMAHKMFGYGAVEADVQSSSAAAGATPPIPPLLTCRQCAQKYHQGGRARGCLEDDDAASDCGHGAEQEEGDSVHGHGHGDGHGHSHTFEPLDHNHVSFQYFVRDVEADHALDWLIGRKGEWLLAGCRERLIQEALEKEQELEEPDNALSLPDIPPSDPPILAHLDRTFTHPSQLVLLSWTHGQPHASELWCLTKPIRPPFDAATDRLAVSRRRCDNLSAAEVNAAIPTAASAMDSLAALSGTLSSSSTTCVTISDTIDHAPTDALTGPLASTIHHHPLAPPTIENVGAFAIQPSPLGGMGCFAVRDIGCGERLLVERPLLRTDLLHLFHRLEQLSTAHRQQYDALHAWHPDPRASRAEQIWTANTFVTGDVEGLFLVASRFNHACSRSPERNVDYRYDQEHNVLVLTAAARVAAGTELLISYGQSVRMMQLRYGFTCRCSTCENNSESLANGVTAEELYRRMW
ncbi:hypothetical protein SEPCBS119000_003038 [Sporothrix epigloea]|uniref:SET domain-containing protein n=1 Tax=Sporothrix epigloea TaxID=1892477 RepID=A0ABP0DL59_9PEZI